MKGQWQGEQRHGSSTIGQSSALPGSSPGERPGLFTEKGTWDQGEVVAGGEGNRS